MPFLSTSGDYAMVRAAIDLSVTASVLPDATIQLDIFQGAAEAELLGRYPDIADAEGADLVVAKRAAAYLTAARILPRLPNITSEDLGDQNYNREPIDIEARVKELRALAWQAAGDIADPDMSRTPLPFVFDTISGRRGR